MPRQPQPNPARSPLAGFLAMGLALCLVALGSLMLTACSAPDNEEATRKHEPSDSVTRGLALYGQYQCASCHSSDWGEIPEQSCNACHLRIRDVALGRRRYIDQPTLQRYTEEQVERAHERIIHLRELPRLEDVGELYRSEWLAAYLQSPHDLRPRLDETMPRFRIDPEQAKDLVAYLKVSQHNGEPDPKWQQREATHWDETVGELPPGDAERGQTTYADLGCGSCHAYSDVTASSPKRGHQGVSRGMLLAPDLRVTRDRFRRDRLVAYLLDPQRGRPAAAMPHYDMTLVQARDLAAFLFTAPLHADADDPPARATFLPPLQRSVGYPEVASRVFQKICVHCHGPTTGKRVADGPGNSGGFGFEPRQLDLSSYEGVRAGVMLDGQRSSIVRPQGDQAPLLLQVLKARHHEERTPKGQALPDLRGMPLALPGLPLEEIQLIETWLAQGAPLRAR